MHRFLAALLCILLLAPASAHAATDPGAFNVRVTDLPTGTLVLRDLSGTPARVYPDEPTLRDADLEMGVVALSARQYSIPGGAARASLLSFILRFTSPGRAHAYVSSGRRGAATAVRGADRLLAMPGVGNEGFALVGFFSAALPSATVIFWRGAYVAFFSSNDTRGYSATLTMRLGAAIDARIRAG